jgi:hypothetical protein
MDERSVEEDKRVHWKIIAPGLDLPMDDLFSEAPI